MIAASPARAPSRHGVPGRTDPKLQSGVIMIWETPVAIDLRLGMEITMYADHR